MLEVDLQAADEFVAQAVTEYCSAYGRVTSVKVHREPSPFALVEMARRDQSFEVAARYGGSTFGTATLVHLKHKVADPAA